MPSSFFPKSILAREILDSRGTPTIEVRIETARGVVSSSVPSGASTGKWEAVEKRDGGARYGGKGVRTRVRVINEKIAPLVRSYDLRDQGKLDTFLRWLDGTDTMSHLGANTTLALSMAWARAGALVSGVPLFQYIHDLGRTRAKALKGPSDIFLAHGREMPVCAFNILNGGVHAGNGLSFQEFMVVPSKKSPTENIRVAVALYRELKAHIVKKFGHASSNVGDEGGFAPPMKDPREALDAIYHAMKKSGHLKDVSVYIDVASSEFFSKRKYRCQIKGKEKIFSARQLLSFYEKLLDAYPIGGLEDPFSQDDWPSWTRAMEVLRAKNKNLLLIGDDLLVTNPERIRRAHDKRACNAMILKLNQIGTVWQGLESAVQARSFGWKIIVSHRSGETTDDFIADFAVGIRADVLKAGAPARGERVAKYNRLMAIEREKI